MPRNSVPPKVSVLIPVYNVEKYVERCILSVLNQTMQEGVEVIIVNDCTPDRSMEMIRKLLRTHLKENGMMVSIVEHEKNRGQAAARNTLMKYAIGDYTIFVDSDDYVEHDMLEKMYSKAVETDADIVMADFWNEHIDKHTYMSACYSESKRVLLGNVIRGKCNNLWNKLIRRSLYIENNINWSEGYDMAEDYSVMVPLCFTAHKVVYIPSAYYHYVQYNLSSITKRAMSQRELDGSVYGTNNMIKFIEATKIMGFDADIAYRLLFIRYWCILNSIDKANKNSYLKLYSNVSFRYKFLFVMHTRGIGTKVCTFLITFGCVPLLRVLLLVKNKSIPKSRILHSNK